MEYKKCEHCGEEIHIRSKKCPFCNQTVEEVPPQEEIKEEEVVNEVTENQEEPENSENLEENEADNSRFRVEDNTFKPEEGTTVYWEKTNNKQYYDSENPSKFNFEVGPNGEPKDYIYRAEVRHSLEYTQPMSNMVKVFLSIFMFAFYLMYVKWALQLIGSVDINSLLQ